ncbi:hypothetical protein ACVILK_002879 [Bradyrhizobium embrapense]
MKKLGRLFTALILFPPCFGSALAANFKFDPAACKQNTGSFYVALGRSVFETPGATMGNVVIDPIEDFAGSKPLKVPDPSEPKGCFGNPLQSNSHSILHDIVVKDTGSGLTKHMAPDLFQLINLNGGSHAPDGGWWGEWSERESMEYVCKRTTLHDGLDNGLIACRIKPTNSPNERQEDWAASYTAKPENYLTPLGKPFAINCGPGLLSTGIDHCDVAYAINSDVGLSYRFQPYRSSHPIPIDQIITYDRSLREAIGNALVKDYPWPNQ